MNKRQKQEDKLCKAPKLNKGSSNFGEIVDIEIWVWYN